MDNIKDYMDSQLRTNKIYNLTKNTDVKLDAGSIMFLNDLIQHYEEKYETKLTDSELVFTATFGSYIIDTYLEFPETEVTTVEDLAKVASDSLIKLVNNYIFFSIDTYRLENEVRDLKEEIEKLKEQLE
jgi:hypothetical protein